MKKMYINPQTDFVSVASTITLCVSPENTIGNGGSTESGTTNAPSRTQGLKYLSAI